MTNPLRSLAARITALVLAATLVSSLTVSWIAAESLDRFLRENVDQRLPQVADRIARELDHWYSLRTHELESAASSASLIETAQFLTRHDDVEARRRREPTLRPFLENSPELERLILTKTNGQPLIQVGGGEPVPNGLLTRPIPAAESTHFADPEPLGGRRIQIVSAPVHDPDGRLIARLYTTLDLARLHSVLGSAELGATADVFLVDRDLHLVNPPDGLGDGKRYDNGGIVSKLTSSVRYYENPRGIRVIGTQTPFSRFGWSVVIEQPYDDAFAPIVSSTSRVALLNGVIVLVVGLLAFRIARSIVKPLRALSGAAKRLSNGERGVEIDENAPSTDDVRALTRTFNEMSRGLGRNARELEENQRAIESANRELVAKNEELSNVNLVLEQLSITDGLTKLHNHRYFQEAIAAECKRSTRTGEPLCLILIDIDSFKKWNDRLGHAGGDEILRRMADVLNRSVRETDLLARYGGEEFALLAINTTLAGAAALGEKVRLAVEAANLVTDVPSEKHVLTVSVGLAAFHGDRTQLFVDADEALYAAKDAGRNRVIVAPAESSR